MKKSVTGLKNRILSWLLALTMIVSMVCSNGTVAFATAAGNPDPVSVTLGITGSDGKDLAGKAEVEFTASGSVGSPVTGKAGETIELQSATAYSYKITCIGYKEQAGNFTTTAEAAQTFTKSLEVKNSEITFVTKANGSAISNVQVSVDGGTAETVDGAGKLVKQLQEGGKYRIVANADGYDTKDFEYTVPTGTDKAVSEIDMGDKYAVVNFSVTHGSNKLSSATISCKENTTGTEIKAIYDATKGTYQTRLKIGKTYTVSGQAKGFVITDLPYTVDETNLNGNLSANLEAPIITADKSELNYPDDRADLTITNAFNNESAYGYQWHSTNEAVAVAELVDGKYAVVPKSIGLAKVYAVCTVNGKEAADKKSNEIEIIVNKGSATTPLLSTADTVSENTDKTSVTFTYDGTQIPSGENGTLEIEASGNCLAQTVKQSFAMNTSDNVANVTMPFDAKSFKDGFTCLTGEISYKYKFISDNYDYEPTTGDIKRTYYKTQSFDWKMSKDNLVYGDSGITVVPVEGYDENHSALEYSVDKTDILEISSDGKVTVKNAGAVNVTVIRKQDDTNFWAESKKIYSITVDKKEIDPFSSVVSYSGTRIYNGDTAVDAAGAIAVESTSDGPGLEAADAGKIKISAKLTLPSPDVREYSATDITITIKSCSLAAGDGDAESVRIALNNYKLPNSISLTAHILNGKITIEKKKLTLKVASATVEHQNFNDFSQYTFDSEKPITVDGFAIDADKELLNNIDFYPGLYVDSANKNVGEYTDAISVRENTGNPGKNYIFDFNNQKKGNLKVLSQTVTNVFDFISINNDRSQQVYMNGDHKIYYRSPQNSNDTNSNDTIAQFDIKDTTTYNTLYQILENGTENVLNEEKLVLIGEGEQTIHLKLGYRDGEKENISTTSFDVTFICDADNPEVNIQIVDNKNVVKSFINAITFGIFTNKTDVVAKVNVSDASSGWKQWAYYVADTRSDVIFGEKNITQDMVLEIFENPQLSKDLQSKFTIIRDVPSMDNIPIAKIKDGKAELGNYIVFVYAEDMVGNNVLYSSTGTVIDDIGFSLSEMKIDFSSPSAQYDKMKYYNTDAEFWVTVNGNADQVYSGVDKITYTLEKDGVKEPPQLLWSSGYTKPENLTIEQLEQFNEVTTDPPTIIEVEKGSSKIVKVGISVKDFSGNESTNKGMEGMITIDGAAPAISNEINSNAVAENVKYYSQPVTLTTTITERFLDVDNGIEYSFDGGEKWFTLLDLKNNPSSHGIKAGSITVNHKNNGSNGKVTDLYEELLRSDVSQTIVEMTFEEDSNYNITVKVTDKARNITRSDTIEGTSDKIDFVVDQTKPEIVFGNLVAPNGVQNEKYYKDETTLKITVTEMNFNDEIPEVTVTPALTQGENPDKLYTFSKWTLVEGTKDEYTGTLTFQGNGDYEVSFKCTDLAGNQSDTVKQEKFTVDKEAPKIANTIDSAAMVENDKYYKADVKLQTVITERCLNIERDVVYSINNKEVNLEDLLKDIEEENYTYGVTEATFSPDADDDEAKRTDSSTYTVNLKFSIDNVYNVSVSVTDKAGNTSNKSIDEFVVDKTAPKATVTYYDNNNQPFAAGTNSNITYLGENHTSFTVKITVDELNFANVENEKNVAAKFVINTTDSSGNPVKFDENGENIEGIINGYGADAESLDFWYTRDGSTEHTYYIDVLADANYIFDFSYTDLAGNPLEMDVPTGYVTLDKTRPTGTVVVDNLINYKDDKAEKGWFNDFLEAITFGYYGREKVDVHMASGDATSGLSSTGYYTTHEQKNRNELMALDAQDWKPYTDDSVKIPYEANQNIIVYQRVEDKAGNVEYYSTDNIVIDNVSAEIQVTVTPEAPGRKKGIYNAGEIKGFGIYVKDPAAMANADSYAGIKSIQYRLTALTDTGETVYITGRDNKGYVPLPSFKSKGLEDHVYNQEHTGFVELKALAEHSCHYTIEVQVEDWSDNVTNSLPVTIVVDPIRPEIRNEYDSQAKIRYDRYYNKDVVLTTTITERYLDINNDVIYDINKEKVTFGDLIANKEQYGVSSVTVAHERDETKKNDSSISTITVTFHADNDYVVSTSVLDKAGNAKGTEVYNFVIDQTAPEATLTYYSYGKGDTFAPGSGADNIAYLGEDYSSFKVEITVEELNFTLNGNVEANLIATATNSNTENVDLGTELSDYTANGKKADSWTGNQQGSTTHKYSVDVANDANYTFDFDYTDLAGNPLKVKVATGYVTLDKVRPMGTVTVHGLVNDTGENGATQSWASQFIKSITFGLFGKNNLSATMESADVTAGVAKTEYLYTSQLMTRDALAGRTDWSAYNAAVSLAANQNVIVYEKVTDKAGNVEYYSTDNLVADNVDPAPTVTITPSSPAWGKGVYSAGDNPGFDISVTDPVVNDAYSGLKEITYRIINGAGGHTETGTLASFTKDAHQQSWTGHVSIDPKLFYSNNVQVTVYASDWSTNDATSEVAELKIDSEAPTVKFDMSTGDVLNGKYYKNNKTLTITVDERNFDPSYTPTVTSTAGGGYSFNGWSTNGEITTGTITFSGDSDYTVTFDCYDLAGNKSNTERQEEFTVDKTLPVINVAYDNNSALNDNYYKASRTATVTITEHNFRASEVRVTTTASLDGKAISAPTAGGWSSYGDRHTAVISYPADGDYTFDITYTDLAGNASTDYAIDSFTVDLTNPEIEITGIKDKSANKGTVAPVITFTDVNFATENVTLTLTGANKGKVPVDGMVSRANRNNGTTVTFKNFGKDMDDIYTLTAKTTDKAGNETSKSISFSVNRNGSTYEIDSATQAMLKSGFTNNPKDIVIKEINVDTLEFIEITYSKDGKVVKLKEGTDYIVKAEGGEGQWKKYTYTIKAECFEEEGEYSINIYSEDRATNTSTNKVKAKNLEFIVDKTPPTVSIANLENRGRYREDIHQFTLSVKDNTVLSYVELYIDGELVRTYSGDELTVVDGVITIDVDSRSSYQNIKLVAYDAAGNPTEPVEYEVLVTSSWWVQFFMNKPLFFGCIAAILVVAAGAALLVVKAKKRK